MAFEHYIYTGTTRLRCGYTTGSCAALAAKAACEMLLSRKPVGRVSIVTPGGLPVEADVVDACIGEGCAQCAVRKDAGDDADVTDGVLVYARVEHAGSGTGAAGSKGAPARESEVSVDGGVGVGRVTLPGLEQSVGAAAINATPRAMITSAVREVCAHVVEWQTDAMDERVNTYVDYMEAHFDDPELCASSLANEFHVSEKYLFTLFKKKTGYSPTSYLHHIRMERAAQLLRETELSVAEIARAVGYESQSKFTAAFKEYFGRLPKEYRKTT